MAVEDNTNGSTPGDGQEQKAGVTNTPDPAAEAAAKGDTLATGKDGKADDPKPEVAPDKYEDFTLPENFEADNDVVEEFKTVAKELNISQEKAQKLVDLQTKLFSKQSAKMAERWNTLQDKWVEEAKNDKEYGGQNFEKSLGAAKLALEKFGNPALNKLIEQTGMGNNPEFIRLLVKVGNTVKEDNVMTGGNGVGEQKSAAKTLFPSMA
jgi:hypothetical protein